MNLRFDIKDLNTEVEDCGHEMNQLFTRVIDVRENIVGDAEDHIKNTERRQNDLWWH